MSAGWIYRRGVLHDHDTQLNSWTISMKRSTDPNPTPPVHDYELALQRAVSWLGDRHILATPSARLPAANVRQRFLARPTMLVH